MSLLQELAPQPVEVEAIDSWNRPRDPQEIRSLLGRLSAKAFADNVDQDDFDLVA